MKVIGQLDEALVGLPTNPTKGTVAREVGYLQEHEPRMGYPAGRRAGELIGSGPVEATCRQAQCRFKRPRQFWSAMDDKTLL